MHVEAKKLVDFLRADGRPFSIPLFQRPYAWERWQCEVLWNDIMRAAEADSPYFLGAVFYRVEDDGERPGEKTISLIDGQQRTLTSLLLLSALAERLGQLQGAEIERAYLRAGEAAKVRVSPRDRAAFARELPGGKGGETRAGDGAPGNAPHNAEANKALFREKMADPAFDAEAFWRGLGQLEIVAVELDENDDAPSIFESFNAKGVPLVAADMVRNYVLLAETPEEQGRLFETYWEPIQGLFGDDSGSLRLNNALRAWTVIRCKTPRAKSDAECFDDFKQYFLREYDGSVEDLLEELLSFCTVWAENYRYHAVKKYRSSNWAKLGRKTLVSGRRRAAASDEARRFYADHYGVPFEEEEC